MKKAVLDERLVVAGQARRTQHFVQTAAQKSESDTSNEWMEGSRTSTVTSGERVRAGPDVTDRRDGA